jgi:hypothetical protein
MAAVAVVSTSVLVTAQAVEPPAPPRAQPTVRLLAAVQPLVFPPPGLKAQPVVLLDSADAAPTPLAVPIAPNLANTIDSAYNAVEPWVRYGFQVATAAVSWIPYVGWFAGQIMVFYNFGESIVASGVFNFTDWLRGNGGIAENVVDFGIDVGLAFVWLGLDEVAQVIPLPPFCCYPPRPPVQGPFLAAEAESTETTETTETTELTKKTESTATGDEVSGNAQKSAKETTDPGSEPSEHDAIGGDLAEETEHTAPTPEPSVDIDEASNNETEDTAETVTDAATAQDSPGDDGTQSQDADESHTAPTTGATDANTAADSATE